MQPQIFGLSFLALKNRYFAQGIISIHDFQTGTFLKSLSREHKPTKFLWLRLRGCERRYHKKTAASVKLSCVGTTIKFGRSHKLLQHQLFLQSLGPE